MKLLSKFICILAILYGIGVVLLLVGIVIMSFTKSLSEGFSKLGELISNPIILVYFLPAFLLYGLSEWLKGK